MSLFLGVLSAAVALDDSDYQKKLKGLEKSSDDSFSRIASAAGRYLTAAAILNFGRQAIQTFSDLEESTNKFNVVFQGFSKQAGDAVDELREKFGQSELSAKKMLSGTGDILTGFGFDRKLALDMSMLTAQLGSDLASFTNYAGGAAGATDALTKAMLGETESAKMLGIVIKQDSEEYKNLVEQAMTTGVQVKEGGEKIVVANEQQAKAVAALALAYQQSKNAHGDFLRSQDSIANQTQILKNNLTEMYTVIGKESSGVFSDSLRSANALIKCYTELSPATRTVLNNTVLLTAALTLLGKKGYLKTANDALKAAAANISYAASTKGASGATALFSLSIKGLSASLKKLWVDMGPVGWAILAIGAAYTAVTAIISAHEEALRGATEAAKEAHEVEKQKTEDLKAQHDEEMTKLQRLEELAKYERLNSDEKKEANKIAEELNQSYTNLGITINSITGKLHVNANAWKSLTQQQAKAQKQQLKNELKELNSRIKAVGAETANVFKSGVFFPNDVIGGSDIRWIVAASGVAQGYLNMKQLKEIYDALLVSNDDPEATAALAHYIDLRKEQLKLEEKIKKLDESGTKNAQERRKKQAEIIRNTEKEKKDSLYELTEYEWQIKFDESDFDKQLKMLKEKADKTFSNTKKIHYSSIDKLLAADTHRLSKRELELRKEILEIREKEKRVAEKVADQEKRQNEERRRYFEEERRRNIDIENARKAIKEFEWQQYFDKSDDDTKLILLADRAMKLRDKLEYIKSINDSSFSDQLKNAKEELRIKQELKEVEEQRGAIYRKWREDQDRKEQKERENFRKYSYENESFNDFLELRKKDKEVSKITKAVEELRSAGYNDKANAIIQKQLDYYKKQAIQLKKEFIVLSKSPNQIDDDYIKRLNSIRENMEKAFSDANYWQNRLDADKDLDRRHENARETIGAWSLAALSRMTGSSPEVQTAKNTRETSRKMTELLELEKKRPSLTF